ncbi:MAG: beta-lactamase family protein [Bacteroidales bacterium]|nr:beta-lactamase family protein [Bacteroidales bacterium]NTV18812.1 beta-lactamase family protein [Bacteroidales bacterium]
MKRSKKLSSGKILVLSLFLIISVSLAFGFRDVLKGAAANPIAKDEDLPMALNLLLSNELSDFPETKKLDGQIERFMREWRIKGASLAIMKDEKLIYTKGYGWADEGMNVRVEPRHIFRIASVSKLITAVGIMKLIEDDSISLKSKVFGEGGILDLPQFQNISDKRIKSITIEDLLRHRGGFTLGAGDPMFITTTISKRMSLDSVPSPDDVIEYAISRRLGFAPGNGTRYSNLGYVILSRVIEQVSGKPYEDYIKERILNPAGIYDMHLAHNLYSQKFPNEVRYYEPENEVPVEAFDGSGAMLPRCYGGNNIEGLMGAGAWVASPSELLLFVASIDGRPDIPDIINEKSIDIMTTSTSQILPIGWAKVNKNGDWSRTGTLSGSSALLKYQRDGISWVFITNTSSWKGSTFPRQIDAMFRKSVSKVSHWPKRDLFELKTQQ